MRTSTKDLCDNVDGIRKEVINEIIFLLDKHGTFNISANDRDNLWITIVGEEPYNFEIDTIYVKDGHIMLEGPDGTISSREYIGLEDWIHIYNRIAFDCGIN